MHTILLIASLVLGASAPRPEPKLTLAFDPAAGDSLILSVRVELAKGWSINSAAPLDSELVPTRLVVASPGAEFGAPLFPKPVLEFSKAWDGNLSLYKGSFEIKVPGKRIGRSAGGKAPPPVKVSLRYQSCDGGMCYPPKTVEGTLP